MTTKNFILFLVTGFIFLSVVSFFLLDSLTQDFKEMEYDKSYQGVVVSIWTYRGFGYLTLSNDYKYLIHDSRNYDLHPFTLSKFIQEGDSIKKEMHSNSFKIIRNLKEYQFYLGKNLGTRKND